MSLQEKNKKINLSNPDLIERISEAVTEFHLSEDEKLFKIAQYEKGLRENDQRHKSRNFPISKDEHHRSPWIGAVLYNKEEKRKDFPPTR